jgi:hypothetical protein
MAKRRQVSIILEEGGSPVKFMLPRDMEDTPENVKAYGESVIAKHQAFMKEAKEMGDPTSDSDWENFRAGIGRGMSNIVRNVANIAGVEGYDDETLRQKNELDEALLSTKAGMAGNIAGEIAITAPVTGALMAGGKVIQGADKLRKGNLFRKTLGSSPVVLGADAALTTGVALGPDNRLENAALGGTLGLATGGVIKGGGKLFSRPGIRKSRDALRLERLVEGSRPTPYSIPLSQSGTGIGRTVYEGIVANFPGSAKMLRGQYDKALQGFRSFIADEALPIMRSADGSLVKPPTPIIFKNGSAQQIVKELRHTWEDAWQAATPNLKKLGMRLDFGEAGGLKIPKGFNKFLKEVGAPPIPKDIKTMTGEQLITLKNHVNNAMSELGKKDWIKMDELVKLNDNIDDIILKNVGTGKGVIAKELEHYKELRKGYKKYQDVIRASRSALDEASEYTPKALLKATNKTHRGVEGSGALNVEAKTAKNSLRDFASREGIYQLIASGATVIPMLGGYLAGGLAGAAATVPMMMGAATPGFQRFIAGQNPTMRELAKKLRRNKEGLKFGGSQALKSGILLNE